MVVRGQSYVSLQSTWQGKKIYPGCTDHDPLLLELAEEMEDCAGRWCEWRCQTCSKDKVCQALWDSAALQSTVGKLTQEQYEGFHIKFQNIKKGVEQCKQT